MEIDAEITPCQLSQPTLHLSPNEYMLRSQGWLHRQMEPHGKGSVDRAGELWPQEMAVTGGGERDRTVKVVTYP